MDDGRLGLRCPPGSPALPAVYRRGDRRQLRRDPVVGAGGPRLRHRDPGRPRGDHARDRRRAGRGGVPDDHGPGATAAARPVDRRRPSPRVRHRRPVAAHATRGDRLRAARDPGFLGHVSAPAGRLGDVLDGGRPGDGPRRPVGGRDRDLVRRVGGAGQPGLREVRRHRRGPAAADRLPRRLRPVARRLLVLDRGALPVHPAGHPARHLQLGLERVLQRRPARATSPGPGLQRRRARARSGRSFRASSCSPRERSWRSTRCSGSA